ncbi:MAG: hypothetical protein ACRDH8_06045 [Actinomycetota bacterium]
MAIQKWSNSAPAVYFTTVLGRYQDTPVAEIAYVRPMITAIVVTIIAAIVAHIVVANDICPPLGVKDP